MHLLQSNLTTATVWWMDYQRIPSRDFPPVQNTAARQVFNLRKYDRIPPALVTLQGLSVKNRIEFKTPLIVFERFLARHLPTSKKLSPHRKKKYSIKYNENVSWRLQNSSMILSGRVRSQCMDLWHGIFCQRNPKEYVMKLKHSSNTLRPTPFQNCE